MREVYAEAMPDPWYSDLLPAFDRVPASDLPTGLVDGYLMDVPMIAPPIYLQVLHDQFIAAGGVIEERNIDSLNEAAAEADLLVNCSGIGARRLADDAAVYPMRGQTMLIDAPDIALGYMDNERVDHIFPRADGVLIGGVKLDGDWRRQLDPAISADIIRRTSKIESGIAEAKVRREFTGLRPGRAQVRLELERRPSRQGCHPQLRAWQRGLYLVLGLRGGSRRFGTRTRVNRRHRYGVVKIRVFATEAQK